MSLEHATRKAQEDKVRLKLNRAYHFQYIVKMLIYWEKIEAGSTTRRDIEVLRFDVFTAMKIRLGYDAV
jgi:hypothetical protein